MGPAVNPGKHTAQKRKVTLLGTKENFVELNGSVIMVTGNQVRTKET